MSQPQPAYLIFYSNKNYIIDYSLSSLLCWIIINKLSLMCLYCINAIKCIYMVNTYLYIFITLDCHNLLTHQHVIYNLARKREMFTEGEKQKAWNSGNIINLGPLTFSSPRIDCISKLSHTLTGHSDRRLSTSKNLEIYISRFNPFLTK